MKITKTIQILTKKQNANPIQIKHPIHDDEKQFQNKTTEPYKTVFLEKQLQPTSYIHTKQITIPKKKNSMIF